MASASRTWRPWSRKMAARVVLPLPRLPVRPTRNMRLRSVHLGKILRPISDVIVSGLLERTGDEAGTYTQMRRGAMASAAMEQGVDENPGEADGDEHGQEDEGEHEGPGGAGVLGAGMLGRGSFGFGGCLGRAFFCGIAHRD